MKVSEKIASEMVSIDDHNNGWRNLVLPIAQIDTLVMNAVLTASASHILNKALGHSVDRPCQFYARALRELQERQQLDAYDKQTRYFVVLAIMVLLTAVMVNGWSDFPPLFRLLESAFDAVGGEAEFPQGELPAFISRQIRKFVRFYSAAHTD